MRNLNDLASVRALLQEKGFVQGIRRIAKDISVDVMDLIETIGRERDPRFILDRHNTFVYLNFAKWLLGDSGFEAQHPDSCERMPGSLSKGIFISGLTGVGKSVAFEVMGAVAHLLEVPIDLGYDGSYQNPLSPTSGQYTLLTWRPISVYDIIDEYVRTSSIDRFIRQKILCIDDLGIEPLESMSMGSRLCVLRSLLEARGNNPHCLTLISSNYPFGALRELYGDRVHSRLYEMCNYFELLGDDRRQYIGR